ncbi:hypothetical protein CVS28_09590 [Arthrobacter glacialis]|nr:hypothetical protein CVS28_09590 [Arthrobacter glacialis]
MIDADCSTGWDIITDHGNYTAWPFGILRIQAEVRHGCTIKIRTTTGGRRTFRLRVRQVPGTVMTWTGGMPRGATKAHFRS